MYEFKITDNLNKFNQFVIDHDGSFFQTSIGAKMKREWIPTYIIGTDKEGKMVLTALLLTKTIFKYKKISYVHSGFVGDYDNEGLIKEALAFLRQETKKRRIAFTFIDPEIILKINGKVVDEGREKQLKWKHYGLRLTTEKEPFVQPKFTYILNLLDDKHQSKSLDEIIGGFEKGVRYSVRTSPNKGLKYEQYSYDDIVEKPYIIDEFMNIMKDTMTRLETIARPKSYYLNVMKELKDHLTIDMVYYDYDEDTKNYENNVSLLKQKATNELQSKIDAYHKRSEELVASGINIKDNKKLYLACGITVFYGHKTTCLYGGTKNILRNATRSSHYLNYMRIENSIKRKMSYHDFLRAHVHHGNAKDKNHGLTLFKKSFGADEIEYIGEYTMINNYLLYVMFKTFYKPIRKIILAIKHKKKS